MTKKELLQLTRESLQLLEKVDLIKPKDNNPGCTDCTDCTDCTHCADNTNCVDCSNCTGCTGCTGCSNSANCTNCVDCTFCTDCMDCSNCYNSHDCVGIKHGTDLQYVAFGVQLSEEEYQKFLSTYR